MEGPEKPLVKPVFEPIGEGLGFHPYSEGLPYATTSKVSQALTKSGTAKAKPPTFQPPYPPRKDWREQLQSQTAKELPLRNTQAVLESVRPAFIAAKPAESFGWIYLLRRSLAGLLDFSILAAVLSYFAKFWLESARYGQDWLSHPGVLLIQAALFIGFFWVLLTAQDLLFKTTIGKAFLGLQLKGSRLRILARSIAMIPSFGFAGVGLLWMLFHPTKKAWHDDLAGLQPTRSSS